MNYPPHRAQCHCWYCVRGQMAPLLPTIDPQSASTAGHDDVAAASLQDPERTVQPTPSAHLRSDLETMREIGRLEGYAEAVGEIFAVVTDNGSRDRIVELLAKLAANLPEVTA